MFFAWGKRQVGAPLASILPLSLLPLSLLQIFEDRPPQILFLGWRSAVVIIDESLFNIFEIFLANIDEVIVMI